MRNNEKHVNDQKVKKRKNIFQLEYQIGHILEQSNEK